jgi:hypothetical protein
MLFDPLVVVMGAWVPDDVRAAAAILVRRRTGFPIVGERTTRFF